MHVEWARHCQNTQIADQTCRIENQSLLGALARLPGIDLACLHQLYPLLVLLLTVACYGWIYWSRRQQPTPGPECKGDSIVLKDNLHLALLFILMTLAHPRAWTCNFVALTPACFFLADWVCRRLPGWKVAGAALVLLILVRVVSKSEAGEFSWIGWLHQGKDFWAALAVAGACCWCATAEARGSCLSLIRPDGIKP